MNNIKKNGAALALTGLICLLPACDSADAEPGELRITMYGEDFIEDRVPADEVIDGWEVVFSKFLVAAHDIEARGGEKLPGSFVMDLRPSSGGAGHDLGVLEMSSGLVGMVGYRIAPAAADATGNASAEDIAAMAEAGDSIRVVGTATKGDVTLTFDWGFSTDTHYAPCETEADVPEGGEGVSQLTIHSDHLLYDDLDSEEPNVAFDIIASADADGDMIITEGELAAVDITGETRYQVGSRDITDLWSFIEAQTKTVGHIDGEGHCETHGQ